MRIPIINKSEDITSSFLKKHKVFSIDNKIYTFREKKENDLYQSCSTCCFGTIGCSNLPIEACTDYVFQLTQPIELLLKEIKEN